MTTADLQYYTTDSREFSNTSLGPAWNSNQLLSSEFDLHSSPSILTMDSQTSPEFLHAPLIQSMQLKNSLNRSLLQSKSPKKISIKDIFQSRKQNLSHLDELAKDHGYRVYYTIFRQIRWLLIILGLWAPQRPGCAYWCLRNLYPVFIYLLILYPWTTFFTQESYWSVPVFLFINLHLSGIFAYGSARQYWKQNHLITFITSTFIPFYDDLVQFERRYRESITEMSRMTDDTDDSVFDSPRKTLKMGFQQRYKNDNRKRKRQAKQKYGHHALKNERKRKKSAKQDTFDIHASMKNLRKETQSMNPFAKSESNLSSWASIAGSENKLSLSLFYEAVRRMSMRFWCLTLLTALPIIVILSTEIIAPNWESSISNHSAIKSQVFIDVFIPFNVVITFIRIFYNICEFIFMAVYFQFICECHRGDLLIHLHYYDTSDIEKKYKSLLEQLQTEADSASQYQCMLRYCQEMEMRLASIVWDWDRIASSTRDTSKAFRWWIFVMVVFNFIAGVTAIINLTTHSLQQFPQHLEMYLPAVINLVLSFYVLLTGTKVAHLNKTVGRRSYFLLANTHFAHIEVETHNEFPMDINVVHDHDDKSPPLLSDDANDVAQGGDNNNNHEKKEMQEAESSRSRLRMELELKKQNIYIQAQTVARAATSREIGISVYGLVLNRNLFLAFFSPFVAFFLFCINTWLPNQN